MADVCEFPTCSNSGVERGAVNPLAGGHILFTLCDEHYEKARKGDLEVLYWIKTGGFNGKG